MRPTFSELVVSLTTQLEKAAGYMDLTALQSETHVGTEEESLHIHCQEDSDTNPCALKSSTVITDPQGNSQSVTEYQQAADDEETTFSS